MEKEWLSTKEVCAELGVSARTLRNWVSVGKIPMSNIKTCHTKYGEENRYHRSILNDLEKKSKKNNPGNNSEFPKEISLVEKTLGNDWQKNFLTLQSDNLKLHDKYAEKYANEKAKSAFKTMLIFVPFFLCVLMGVGLYIQNTQNKKNLISFKRNITSIKLESEETKENFATILNMMEKNLSEKDNTIQLMETQLVPLIGERFDEALSMLRSHLKEKEAYIEKLEAEIIRMKQAQEGTN